ncbi:MAG: nuclear transport factor 2 family protein [Gammaproteobacteria bacterium]|nr:nuclear transport factor 2 family protein [Gammaproteobacteria bacterium]
MIETNFSGRGGLLSRTELADLAEHSYFGAVTRGDLAAILDCFTEDAEIVIRHGDQPTRVLRARAEPGVPHISEFWKHLNANFEAAFTGFEHFIDEPAQRCAATFDVTLRPRPQSPYLQRGTLRLKNCNFFWIRDGRIARMIVYYANPDTGGDPVGKPTGYPPQAG